MKRSFIHLEKFILLSLTAVVFFSCSRKVLLEVVNEATFMREAEMVEVDLCKLGLCVESNDYVLLDTAGNEVPYQLIFGDSAKAQKLIFQAYVHPTSTNLYTLEKGTPSSFVPKTFARFVPERKDDFAWENDLAAYRMFGPALANENPSNGVDVWLKSTDQLVINERYKNELEHGISYHVDHGDGLDCYSVSHTLGAGGIAPYMNDTLYIGSHFDSYRMVESGPLRSVFILTYDSVLVEEKVYKETIKITVDAGSLMNKAEVRFVGSEDSIQLAAGIYLHNIEGTMQQDAESGVIAYAEDAVSDARVPAGRSYVGAFIPNKKTEILFKDAHLLLMSDYKIGDDFLYYFGAGWNKWGFRTDADWFNAMQYFRACVETPMVVNVKNK